MRLANLRYRTLWGVLGLVYVVTLMGLVAAAPAQGLPPNPDILSGTVFLDGNPAPGGLVILACVEDDECEPEYRGQTVITGAAGRYIALVVQQPANSDIGKKVSFFILNAV